MALKTTKSNHHCAPPSTRRVQNTPQEHDASRPPQSLASAMGQVRDTFSTSPKPAPLTAVYELSRMPELRLSHREYVPGTMVEARVKTPILDQDGQPVIRQNGQPATRGETKQGVLRGHDHLGRAVVEVEMPQGESQTFRLNWGRVTALSTEGRSLDEMVSRARDRSLLLSGLTPEAVREAPQAFVGAVNKALERKVVGDHTIAEYIDAIEEAGGISALVGGAVRDVVHELKVNPDATVDQILDKLQDVDIVTDLLPSEVRALCKRIAPEAENAGIWTPNSIDRYGVVGVGSRKEGLDIASLRVGLSGRGGATLGKTIADDVRGRDFKMNELLFLLGANKLVAPSEVAIADAENMVLRPNTEEMDKNELLSMRFLKFRGRGYTASPEDTATMRGHAAKSFEQMSAEHDGQRFVNSFMRIVPGSCESSGALREYIGRLKGIMEADGMADLYTRFVEPKIDSILAEFAARHPEAP